MKKKKSRLSEEQIIGLGRLQGQVRPCALDSNRAATGQAAIMNATQAQRPRNTALRRSRNALNPSRKLSPSISSLWRALSSANCWSMEFFSAASSRCRISPIA